MGNACCGPQNKGNGNGGAFDAIGGGAVGKGDREDGSARQADYSATGAGDAKQGGDGGLIELHSDVVMDVCAVPGRPGQFLSCGDDRSVKRFDWQTGQVLDSWTGHKKCVNRVSYSSAHELVFSASRDKTVRCWRAGQVEAVQCFEGHTLNVQALDAHPSRAQCVSGSRDYSIRVWDVESGQELGSRRIDRNVVMGVRWFHGQHTQEFLQVSEDLRIRVWDCRELKTGPVITFKKEEYFPLSCDIFPDDVYFVASYNGFGGVGCHVKLWDKRQTDRPVVVMQGHEEAVNGCCVVDTDTANHLLRTCSSSGPVREVDLGSHARLAATVGKDQTLKLWNVGTGACLLSSPVAVNSYALTSIAAEANNLFVGCLGSFVSVVQLGGDKGAAHTATTVFRSKGVTIE
jgi:WD40 repeat protein